MATTGLFSSTRRARPAPPANPAASGTDRELERVRTLARVLDHGLVDPLIGLLLPGVGDILGALLGMYAVVVAWRRRVSPVIIARMLLNLGFDAVIGAIPLVGDVFDLGFKANERNVALLTRRDATGGRPTARDWAFVGGAAAVFLGLLALIAWGVMAVIHAL